MSFLELILSITFLLSRRQSISQPGIHDQQPAGSSRKWARRRDLPVNWCWRAASRSSGEILFQISFGYNVKEVLGEKLKEDLFVAKSVGSILSQIIWLSVLPSVAIHYHLVLGLMLSLTPDRLSALLSTRCPGGQSTASFISSGYSVSVILNVKQN